MLCKWQSKLETNLYKEDYLDFRIIGGFEDYGPMKLMKKEVKNIQKIKQQKSKETYDNILQC